MGKIYYMMGKSSSGKDTLFKEVKRRPNTRNYAEDFLQTRRISQKRI